MTKSNLIASLPFDLAGDTSKRLKNTATPPHLQAYYSSTFSHDQFKAGLELLADTHQMSGLDNAGLIITGMPGVGKSTLLNTYVKQVYAKPCYQPSDVVTPLPVLKVRVPGRPTIPRTIEKILMASEHLVVGARRSDSLDRRLHQLIVHQGVEMIIFDEFQHLLPQNATRQVANATINFIKLLVDDHKLAFCFTGLPNMAHVLDDFDEIKDRLAFGEFTMSPFNMNTQEERQDFNTFINSILETIEEFHIDCSKLGIKHSDRELLLMRLMVASEGKARHISMLFAKILMKLRPGDTLDTKYLIDSYPHIKMLNRGNLFNPFTAGRSALQKALNIHAKKDNASGK